MNAQPTRSFECKIKACKINYNKFNLTKLSTSW